MDSVHDRITEAEERLVQRKSAKDAVENGVVEMRGTVIDETEDTITTEITEDVDVVQIDDHIQNIIIDCQMVIELSVKSMFKSVGQKFDKAHDIGFESHNTQGFNSKIPADFHRKEEVIRAIFLTQLWEKFYEVAKYGAPELNVGPSVIFENEDGERALTDATFCVELAEELIEYVDE